MKLLEELTSIKAISGFEYKAKDEFLKIFKRFDFDNIDCDDFGNFILSKLSPRSKKKIVIDAHIDEIGLIVTEITDKGFVKFQSIGGIDYKILPAAQVTILGKTPIKGVIGAKPPHLIVGKQNEIDPDTLYIDTGYDQKEELLKLISVGDPIALKYEARTLQNNCFSACALDDRAGVCAALMAVDALKLQNIDIYLTFSTSEETSLKGANMLSRKVVPDLAIVVDVTHGRTPDGIFERSFPLGGGPVITLGPVLSLAYNKRIEKCAKEHNVNLQYEVEAGHPGTNSWAFHTASGGIDTIMVSIPLKYLHTSIETLNLSDMDETIKLLKNFLIMLDKEEEDDDT